MRRFLTAALLAAAIVVAGLVGYALADIPDATPSTPDPSHTFFGCAGPASSSGLSVFYAFDASVPGGRCPTGWTKVRLVPAATP